MLSEKTNGFVTGNVDSRRFSLVKKEFRAKNSNARGSLFSVQSDSTFEEKIRVGCSESCLDLLERKSQAEVSQLSCMDLGNKYRGQKKKRKKGTKRQVQGVSPR